MFIKFLVFNRQETVQGHLTAMRDWSVHKVTVIRFPLFACAVGLRTAYTVCTLIRYNRLEMTLCNRTVSNLTLQGPCIIFVIYIYI